MLPKTIIAAENWHWMGAHSGLNPLWALFRTLPVFSDALVLHPETPPRRPTLLGRLAARFQSPRQPGSHPCHFVTPIYEALAQRILREISHVSCERVLLTSGENMLAHCLATAPLELKRKLVVLLHQPPSWNRLFWRDNSALQGLGGLVCVSEYQCHYWESVVDTPVSHMRLGVDHAFFTPPAAAQTGSPPRLLFVGRWLRDLRVLHEAMRLLWSEFPELGLDCVVPRHDREQPEFFSLARDPRVRWHAGLSDESLRTLYQGSTLLFLPLLDSTANCAVIEALACGLPVITSATGAMDEYLPDDAGQRCPPGDAAGHANAVARWLKDSELRARASIAAREHAVRRLDWAPAFDKIASLLGHP